MFNKAVERIESQMEESRKQEKLDWARSEIDNILAEIKHSGLPLFKARIKLMLVIRKFIDEVKQDSCFECNNLK